jgi:hypothetical protein
MEVISSIFGEEDQERYKILISKADSGSTIVEIEYTDPLDVLYEEFHKTRVK